MTPGTNQAYPVDMTERREMQRVIDAVMAARLDGVDEADIQRLVSLGLEAAERIEAARARIDWDDVPVLGSLIR